MLFQCVDPGFPERAVAIDPVARQDEGLSLEGDQVVTSYDSAADEAGALEDPEMFGRGGERHLEGLGELRDAGLPRAKELEQLAPDRMSESAVGSIKGGSIFNHLVE